VILVGKRFCCLAKENGFWRELRECGGNVMGCEVVENDLKVKEWRGKSRFEIAGMKGKVLGPRETLELQSRTMRDVTIKSRCILRLDP
jgi:hypothetical protein